MTSSVSRLLAEKPLQGVQLCCTSILPEVRSQLATWAQEMGADHTLDLTSDVTHLLVGDTDSKKYQYVAKEREDVKVLLPEYIEAIRELWMNDQPIDLTALDAEYKCPTLFGLKICITGFEDLDFRNELAKNIVKNGGQYTGDLTKDCTHLIAFTPCGKKYEYAMTWKLKVVSLRWYKDTLDRGMQLDEEKYDPRTPPEQQGLGAWNRVTPGSSKLGKRQRPEQPVQEATRKLRRTASAKLGSQHNDMWNDIVGQGDQNQEASVAAPMHLRHTKSMYNIHMAPGIEARRDSNEREMHDAEQSDKVLQDPLLLGMLSGKHFCIRGFEDRRKGILHETLSSHGAVVHGRMNDLYVEARSTPDSCFIIVPFEIEANQLASLERNCADATIVTELWLEWCMTSKAFVSPEHYVLGRPVVSINMPTVSKLVLNATGFPQRQTLHISKLITKLGAVYQEKFTENTSVLVCNSANPNRQKIEHAQAWNMPVVSEKWLWQLIKNGRIPSYKPFLLVQPPQDASRLSSRDEKPQSNSSSSKSSIKRQMNTAEDSFLEAVVAKDKMQKVQPLSDGFEQDMLSKEQSMRHVRAGQRTNSQGSHSSVSNPDVRSQHKDKPMPLQEVSTNIKSKAPSPTKKKLFQTYDGHSSAQIEPAQAAIETSANDVQAKDRDWVHVDTNTGMEAQLENDDWVQVEADEGPQASAQIQIPQAKSHSAILTEFFEIKAAAEARKAAEEAHAATRPSSRASTKQKLLGRALSNLSNSSKRSDDDSRRNAGREKQSLSRASSINSVNTDGLGVPLSGLSRIPSDLKRHNNDTLRERPSRGNSMITRTATAPLLAQPRQTSHSVTEHDFHAALHTLSTSQPPRPPSPTQQPQLTYADSEEAAKLKAHLAEKRRNRAKLGQREGDPEPELSREESEEKRQNEWREERERDNGWMRAIRDDEALVGGGRRTRGRQKAISALLDDHVNDGTGGAGTGNIF